MRHTYNNTSLLSMQTIALLLAIFAPLTLASPSPQALRPSPPMCKAGQLILRLDHGRGVFDDASQSAMLLILHNTQATACTLPARPELRFQDSSGRTFQVIAKGKPGMHPGPVIPPITLSADGTVASTMRWVSGNAFPDRRCVTPAYILVVFGNDTVQANFNGQLCGPRDSRPSYNATFFSSFPK